MVRPMGMALTLALMGAGCSGGEAAPRHAAPSTHTAAVAAPGATPTEGDATALALEHGVYSAVSGNEQCTAAPPLATVNTFDGEGFDSRNYGDCAFHWTQHTGDTFIGPQVCTDPASKQRETEKVAITVLGPRRYTRANGGGAPVTYGRCTNVDESSYGVKGS